MTSDNIPKIEKNVMFGNGGRDYAVDLMRSISCLMVVAIHASAMIMPSCPYDEAVGVSGEWLGLATIKCITVSATNLFLMISGIFFLSPERNVTISKVWSKNILKMTAAYILWCMIYALLRIYYTNPQPFSWDLFFHESLDREFHLWYIPMMIGIYVVVPLMRVFTAHAERKHYLYVIGLMIGAMTLNTIRTFNGEYPYEWADEITTMINYTPTDLICQYPFYCILGYYLYTYRPTIKTRLLLYFLGVLGVLFLIWITTFLYVKTGNTNPDQMQTKFIIGVLAKNTALFIFVITVFSKVNFSKPCRIILSKLSNATLFIYLSHIFFLRVFIQENWLLDGSLNSVEICLVYIAVTYVCGFIVSLLFLQFIPWVRMRNVVLDALWPSRTIWNGGRKKKNN